MSFSDDDEGEILPEWVTNYFFMDKNNVPISFAVLPFQSGSYGSPVASAGTESHIYMIGDVEGEPQKVYKPVNAWKLELSDVTPVVLVQTKGCGHWIKLRKPSKSFKDMVRTVLVTVHCLHYLKWNGGVSEKVLWENLSRVFSSYEAMPSKSDILDQMVLVRMVVDRDETLANSEFILEILGKSRNWKNSGEDKLDQVAPDQESVVDEDAIINEITRSADEMSDDESMLYDSVCAICDNGGEILCCEGRCLRSFHPTEESGSDTFCSSLGYTKTQVNEIQNFLCLNCLCERHQCFACGKLGSSNRASGAEVFPCVSATCGYFYHPSCVARLLFPKNETDAAEYQKKIVAGESFTCPIHKCHVCEKGENKKVFDLQFAICRRCPRAYHRKCLPKKILFKDSVDGSAFQRAWQDLIPNRILIYCLEHEIDKDLGTPVRNHIIFPCMQEETYIPSDLQSNGGENVVEKTTSAHYIRERPVVKKSSSKERYICIPTSEFCKKASTSNTLKRKVSLKLVSEAPNMHYSPLDNLMPLRKKKAGSHLIQSKQKLVHRRDSVSPPTSVMKRPKYSLPQVDIERKIFDLVEKVSSSITLEDIVGRHTIPSTHSSAAKHFHKTITMGKLEGSVEAVRSALKKLKKGGSTEDAMSICSPEMLKHIVNWRMKLGVYLAPFLHGKRYTSYGRHFTKLGKLKEIVDKLHWYVENDDMIVDFSCGANDFSILMKEKLDLTGKTCRFKNYDLVQPKNDFNFEKRDWFSVDPNELPAGSQLIMGLNPPFGTKASLANKFIDKALEFKPKLLILSVPEETERLDRKAAYDLIWKDAGMLAGKSYYLPGSVDVNGQQLDQWNLKPPVLYLWGRPDWTSRHRHIALLQEHLPEGSDWSDPIEGNVEAYRMDPLQLDGDPGIDGGYADMLLERLGQDNQDEAIQRIDPEEKDYGYQEEQIGQEEGTYDNDELLDMSISPPSNTSDQCQVGIRYGNSEVQSSNPSIANDGSTSNYYNQTWLYDHQAGIEYSSQAIMSSKAITGGPGTGVATTHEPLRIPVMQNNMPKVDEICHARTYYNPLPFDTPFLDGGNIFDEGSSQRGWIDQGPLDCPSWLDD